ncbi:MAG TPA: UDP-N-acetylglucosamine 2-epimerase [Tepidisphaeraceae bacterium]|nr:UDP-N-acetylglucosamine 2-epimerase [Tepidisphaeraceae bacterium]
MTHPRTITFVTGTRAEFGLMVPVLLAIQAHPRLRLQIVATGMHLDRAHGRSIDAIRAAGFDVAATVPWKPAGADQTELARQTALASAKLAETYAELKSDIVLVVGDRVEAFAAASAAHLSGRLVAHVHGGDRALGQVDDALRHAITKFAHLHFPATQDSADRIVRLGEDAWRIKLVGSPGIDGIVADAWPLPRCVDKADLRTVGQTFLSVRTGPQPLEVRHTADGRRPIAPHRYALLLCHPTDADDDIERERASDLFRATLAVPFDHVVVIYPNNDPGSAGVVRLWDEMRNRKYRMLPQQLLRQRFVRNLPRGAFLGLLRDAAVLVGNSSSGIIEAASFGTPVIDVGDRQKGRLRGENVTTVPFRQSAIRAALKAVWNGGSPVRYSHKNPYGKGGTGRAIARHLANVPMTDKWLRKLITY